MPTNTPIPTKSVGNVLAAADWNYLTPLNTMVGLYGAGGAMSGTPPVRTAPNFLIQSGMAAIAFVAGAGTLTFPVAFPNGLLSVITIIHAPTSSSSSTCGPVSGGTFSGSSVSLWAAINGSSLSSTYNVNYIAIGW